MKLRWIPLGALLVLLVSACAGLNSTSKNDESSDGMVGKELNSISLDAHKKVFSNGLTAIVVENHKLPIFTYYTYYKVGGKFEDEGITGASHYLEHMMFKGAKKYGAGEFDRLVEGNGGSNNAYTTNDLTVYYENLPSEHLATMIDLEADRMQNLLLEEKSFESERDVVLEERKMRYENKDNGKIYLKMMQEVFKGTPYGTSVIGKIKDLKSVTRDQMHDYFKKFYAPNNAVILIVGDFDKDDVFDLLEEKFGKIPSTNNLEKFKKEVVAKKGFDFKAKFNKRINLNGTSINPVFMLGFKGVKIGSVDSYALDILASMLGDGESSYLNQEYVQSRKPKLTNVYAANYTLQDAGVFFFGGQLLKGRNLKTFERNFKKKLIKSCDVALDARSLQKIKNQYLVGMLSGLDTNAGIAKLLGDREIYYGDYNFYKKEFGIYNSIGLEQVRSVCKKYLNKEDSIFLSIWNKHKKKGVR